MTKRTVSKGSEYNRSVQRTRNEVGLSNEGKPWLNATNDVLLEGFLVGTMYYKSTRPDFSRTLGRSFESINSQLWKLATDYVDERRLMSRGYSTRYEPRERTKRNGHKFTDRDFYIIGLSCSEEGRKRKAYESWKLAKLLSRGQLEIELIMSKMTLPNTGQLRPMFEVQRKGESKEDMLARQVHENSQYFIKKIERTLQGNKSFGSLNT